ncbi:MAG: FIG00635890: hypothetical protein [uncultured Sphingomonas sp.]|jgi:hypothetical protein|uniref:DUF3035 domain-containing protein n=1 Tax=uncultured Sphingomonas sp. TaxID=158754 RepID=A0A6J4TDB9_9SPHN|nr:DUF3035 domain-containing protein [uncultured Sphingomonas sp.]CAA9519786.1 MAG: FIG00635890: hypothetical protein [uncultured Sphingomonas sp.]
MRNTSALTVALATLALAGCTSLFGSRANKLDEFAVARNAPLVIPPDYTLTPPAPGTATLSASDAQQQAIQALFGGPAPRSASEVSLLEKAGADRAALGIRSQAGDAATQIVDKGATTQTIIAAPQGDSQVASVQTP